MLYHSSIGQYCTYKWICRIFSSNVLCCQNFWVFKYRTVWHCLSNTIFYALPTAKTWESCAEVPSCRRTAENRPRWRSSNRTWDECTPLPITVRTRACDVGENWKPTKVNAVKALKVLTFAQFKAIWSTPSTAPRRPWSRYEDSL